MFINHLLIPSSIFRFLRIIPILMILYIPISKAQDTIVKRNNEQVICKILEVNPAEIKYKRLDYQDGPIFTVAKWELKYVVYGNGIKESFESYAAPSTVSLPKNDLSIQPSGKFYYFKNQKILEPNMLDIAWKLNDKKINSMITQTEKTRFTKNCFLVGGVGLAAGGLLTSAGVFLSSNSRTNKATVGGKGSSRRAQRAARSAQQRVGGYMILGGLSCELVSIVINIHERQNAHFVVDLYNKTLVQ